MGSSLVGDIYETYYEIENFLSHITVRERKVLIYHLMLQITHHASVTNTTIQLGTISGISSLCHLSTNWHAVSSHVSCHISRMETSDIIHEDTPTAQENETCQASSSYLSRYCPTPDVSVLRIKSERKGKRKIDISPNATDLAPEHSDIFNLVLYLGSCSLCHLSTNWRMKPRKHGNSAEMPYDVSETRGNRETRGNAPKKRGNVSKIVAVMTLSGFGKDKILRTLAW
ncbi:hypothetical protein Tco_0964404 [Tanacetum coccineum]